MEEWQERLRSARKGAGLTTYEKLSSEWRGEPSEAVRERVEDARRVQQARFAGARFMANAEMTPTEVRTHCQTQLDEQAQSLCGWQWRNFRFRRGRSTGS